MYARNWKSKIIIKHSNYVLKTFFFCCIRLNINNYHAFWCSNYWKKKYLEYYFFFEIFFTRVNKPFVWDFWRCSCNVVANIRHFLAIFCHVEIRLRVVNVRKFRRTYYYTRYDGFLNAVLRDENLLRPPDTPTTTGSTLRTVVFGCIRHIT